MWYTMDYSSALKDIPPSVTTQINLESSMLSEISQTEKNKFCMVSLICESKEKVELIETESRMVVARG